MSGEATSEFHQWITGGEQRRAAEWLVKTYAGEVVGFCSAMVRDPIAAEDLAQEIFGRALSGLDQFRGDASARSWLLAIARNRCIDHLRARNRDPWRGVDDADLVDRQPAETPLPSDLLQRRSQVEEALASLSEGERALIILRFKNGLGYSELADAFGLREGTVRMRVSRALAKMRDALMPRPVLGEVLEAPRARAAAHQVNPVADEAIPAAAMAPPAAAPAMAPPPVAASKARAGGGLFQRIFGRSSEAPAAAAIEPPPQHSLTSFFAAAGDPVSPSLRERLTALAANCGD